MKTQLKRRQITEESVEAKPRNVTGELKGIATGAINSAWKDLLGGSLSSASEQLLGSSKNTPEEIIVEGNVYSLDKSKTQKAQSQEKQEKTPISAEHMSYFRRIENADGTQESKVEIEVKQRVEEIRLEIKKLVKTSKIVEQTVKDATAEKAPVRPGKYHLSFFEFVLSVIRDATRKLEDSVSYGAVFTSKKQQSKYWSKYKKHGTTFGLSGERTTATQTG